ncbi:unnamed protein product, partial [Ectocarpus sp. 12 AP-2014]
HVRDGCDGLHRLRDPRQGAGERVYLAEEGHEEDIDDRRLQDAHDGRQPASGP